MQVPREPSAAKPAASRRLGGPAPALHAAARPWFAPASFSLDNDPSAGSPTETLLRLLLPLNDQV